MESIEIEDPRTSDERIEDLTFENLIHRWTQAREWEWVMAANVMYGHILEQRARKHGVPEDVEADEDATEELQVVEVSGQDEPVAVLVSTEPQVDQEAQAEYDADPALQETLKEATGSKTVRKAREKIKG